MKIILHIGQSKTGTSAIQAFLTLNRTVLNKHGVLYPSIKVGGVTLDLGAHNAVADALLDKSCFPHLSADEYFHRFFDEAKSVNAHTMILSGEHFFYGEPRAWDMEGEDEYFHIYQQKLERLSAYLEGHEIHLLLYLRPQVDWFASAISQTVRISKLISTKKVYENDLQFFETMKPLLKYSRLVDIWKRTIKPASFIAVPYDRTTLHMNSSISDFLFRTQLIDIDYPHAQKDIQINESLTREYIEVKKILNQTPRSENSERVVIRCLENLSSRSSETTKYTLLGEVRKQVEELASHENERLNQWFSPQKPVFFASGISKSELAPLNSEVIDQALANFYQEYDSLNAKLLGLNFATRTFIRTNLPTVQAIMHNLKMLCLRMKYKNKTT